ncbi:MAG: SIS domain-containing protein [Cyclobacteriaceae bacterium]|nr:SIS domain-containing protein [Cyclobacteriaceae bacterium]
MKNESDSNSGKNTSYTAREIEVQPVLWRDTYHILENELTELTAFVNKVLGFEDLRVIFTGAGTSAYIGDVLHKGFQRQTGKTTEAVATTDLILNPKDYLHKDKPTLLVSFARSGDSPESVAAVELADDCCEALFHLIITCNPEGKLAKHGNRKNAYVLFMPEAANDKALAMTGSFTTMLLAGVLISDLDNFSRNKVYVDKLAAYGEKILAKYRQRIKDVAAFDFKRVVFLGSGPLKGIARESQLKVQELTDGQVVCKYDSFLGLRHGPKAVIDKSTLVVYLFSRDNFVNQYEMDLVRSINEPKERMYEIGIGEAIKNKDKINLDLSIEVSSSNSIPEEYFAVCSVLPAQMLGLYKSINLGLSPDSPSVSNSINRVVKGVNIYSHE